MDSLTQFLGQDFNLIREVSALEFRRNHFGNAVYYFTIRKPGRQEKEGRLSQRAQRKKGWFYPIERARLPARRSLGAGRDKRRLRRGELKAERGKRIVSGKTLRDVHEIITFRGKRPLPTSRLADSIFKSTPVMDQVHSFRPGRAGGRHDEMLFADFVDSICESELEPDQEGLWGLNIQHGKCDWGSP